MAAHGVSLADLTHDIAGPLPPELVLRWNESDKSPETHAQMIAPYVVRGTIVSMDAAGLSKLTQRCSLAESLKLVSEPKELLHALGKVIGGQAIGVWAADNAQMFFPASIDPALVVQQMLAVQTLGKALAVKIGLGIHFGECVSVAGGLFGDEADFIEQIAEDDTRGGEIVVSQSVYERLPDAVRAWAVRREDLEDRGALWSIVDYKGPLSFLDGNDVRYPTPFDDGFFQRLRCSSLEELARDAFHEYRKHALVAFINIRRSQRSLLLDTFTELSLSDLVLRRLVLDYHADLVKSTGALAIVLFEREGEAVAFSRAIVQTNAELGFNARVGIAKGEVFLFPLLDGGRDIAGNSVNVASKLSEDAGVDGILIETSALTPDLGELGRAFDVTISGVAMAGRVLQP